MTRDRRTRRQVLKGLGAAGAAAGSGCLVPAKAQEGTYEVGSERPEYVSWSFEEETLQRYQALLDLSAKPSMIDNVRDVYGVVNRSAERDTFCCQYWQKWTLQTGAPTLKVDGHNGDHEPYYVFVNEDTGKVEDIVFSNYHWFRKKISGDEAPITAEYDDQSHNVSLLVDPDYHHYYEGLAGRGADINLSNLKANIEGWAEEDFFARLHAPAVENPWVMLDREKWWDELTTTESLLFGMYQAAGLYGGDRTAREVRQL